MINAQELIKKVRDIAAEHPNMTYNAEDFESLDAISCHYFPDENNPFGCIIGYAMRSLGCFEIDDDAYDGKAVVTLFELSDRRKVAPLINGTIKEMSWVGRVQEGQDAGETWSQAVANADRIHGKIGIEEE